MWDALRLFGLVAREGSFSGAAGAAGLSAVSLARRVQALEADLGVVLFLRGPSGVTLTEAGRALFEQSAKAAAAMAEVEGAARRLGRTMPSAPVRVSATEPVIAEILAPALPGLLARSEAPAVDLTVADAVVSLSQHAAEVAVRLARPEGDSLKVRRLARLDMGLFRLAGTDGAAVIGYDDKYGEIAEVRWLRQAGLEGRVRVRTSSTRAILAAVAAGAGIGILPVWLAARVPGLVPVPGHPPVPPRDIWMMVHRDVARRPEVRRVMQWIITAFRAARG
jgi:DNA-binding transcriptional LysR family regulator